MPRRRRVNRDLKQIRERKYRLRSRATKFIPAPDSDFARMARTFATHVARHAERFSISVEQVQKLNAAVEEFRNALSRTIRPETEGPRATSNKNDAREEAEKIVRAVARSLRGTVEESLTSFDRLELNLVERPLRLKARACPQVAPVLKFVGSKDGVASGNGLKTSYGGRHILEYGNDFDHGSSAKPHGAVRLELFVELVPDCKASELPQHPAERSGGRLWYLRSFTTSRMEVEFPVCVAGPMLVLYWGRWCDTKGNVGPFSKTCVARVEGGWAGGAVKMIPSFDGKGLAKSSQVEVRQVETKYVILQTPYALTDQSLDGVAIEASGAKMLPAA